jgi:hypothetical protein
MNWKKMLAYITGSEITRGRATSSCFHRRKTESATR